MTVLEQYRINNNLTYKELGTMLDFPPSKAFRLSRSMQSIKLRDALKIEKALDISVVEQCLYL